MKVGLILIVCFLTACQYLVSHNSIENNSANSQQASDSQSIKPLKLLPYSQNFKVGFIDSSGEIVIKAQFDRVFEFSEGLAQVHNGVPAADGSPSSGFINEKGRMIIPMKYDDARDFSEGLAAVKVGENWGYIDKSGKMIIQPMFSQAGEFHEKMAQVGINTDEYYLSVGFIDKTGKYLIKPRPLEKQYESGEYYGVGDFHDNLAQNRIKGKWGFMDRTGKMKIKPIYDEVWDFSEGLAVVKVKNLYGYLDTDGKLAIKPQFVSVSNFYDGLAAVEVKGKQGFIDKTGKIVIAPKYYSADRFVNGYATVITDKNYDKKVVIDKNDRIVVPPQGYKSIGEFHDNLARVQVSDNKWGFVNTDGKLVIPAQFDWAEDFADGLASVSIRKNGIGNFGYIDRTGKYIWNPSR